MKKCNQCGFCCFKHPCLLSTMGESKYVMIEGFKIHICEYHKISNGKTVCLKYMGDGNCTCSAPVVSKLIGLALDNKLLNKET